MRPASSILLCARGRKGRMGGRLPGRKEAGRALGSLPAELAATAYLLTSMTMWKAGNVSPG